MTHRAIGFGRRFGLTPAEAATVAVLLLNSSAVAYGFHRLRYLSDAFTWSVAPALAEIAASRRDAAEAGSATVVEVFHSFSCAACRASAAAIDSARDRFGDAIRWRMYFVTRGPLQDPVGYQAALMAACADEQTAYRFFTHVTGSSVPSEADLHTAALASGMRPAEVKRCVASKRAQSIVWDASFAAHAAGISGTPTIA